MRLETANTLATFRLAISRCERQQLTTGDIGTLHEYGVSYSWVLKSEVYAHYMELTGLSKPTAYNHYKSVHEYFENAKKGKLVFMREKEDPSQEPTATVSISSPSPYFAYKNEQGGFCTAIAESTNKQCRQFGNMLARETGEAYCTPHWQLLTPEGKRQRWQKRTAKEERFKKRHREKLERLAAAKEPTPINSVTPTEQWDTETGEFGTEPVAKHIIRKHTVTDNCPHCNGVLLPPKEVNE